MLTISEQFTNIATLHCLVSSHRDFVETIIHFWNSFRECESYKRKYIAQKATLESESEEFQEKIILLERKLEDAKLGNINEMENATHVGAKLSATRQELTSLKERLQRRDQEISELNHMLKAWEAMRAKKDLQIYALMEKCKENEKDRRSRTLMIHSLQRQITESHTHTIQSPAL